MYLQQRNYLSYLAFAGFLICNQAYAAFVFEPGVGVGVEYTDNVALTRDNQLDDTITVGYVGAGISENEGSLIYDAVTSYNNYHYTQDTYPDEQYFYLSGRADWEMIRDRFNWFAEDRYRQLPIVALDSNTPTNIQDTNYFNFGANIDFPISARQTFSLVPMFSQHYYEVLLTDNKQYSLEADWNYQMFRMTNVGLLFSTRKINYTETNFLGQSIEDLMFTTLGFTFDIGRLRSRYAGRLGVTDVKRENGDETTGFSGFLNLSYDLSSRSQFEALISTDLTDTSSAALVFGGQASGDVQVTTDVIRTNVFNLEYIKENATLRTRIFARYDEITYSESPLDRVVHAFGIQLSHAVTQLLSSGAYADYARTNQLDTGRLDEYYTVGGNLRYSFSRKLYSLFDIKYRIKESTVYSENYDEFSVYATLVYGFGDVQRPSRVGGFY
jgi:hypothetical protein